MDNNNAPGLPAIGDRGAVVGEGPTTGTEVSPTVPVTPCEFCGGSGVEVIIRKLGGRDE